MALSSCLRRCRSSVIPLAIRFVGSSIEHPRDVFSVDVQNRSGGRCLPGVQLLPCLRFSTNPVTKAINLTGDIRTCSHMVAPIPSDVPFIVRHYLGTRGLYLSRKYQEESVMIIVGDLNQNDVDHPFIPLEVTITKGNTRLSSQIILMPNRIEIRQLTISGAEEALKEYLEAKQIISSKLRCFLYDRLQIT